MKKICIFTSTRADFGLLSNLILELNKNNISTNLVAMGTHLSKEYGKTIKEISDTKIKVFKKLPIKIVTKKKIHISNIVSETIKKSSKLIEKVKPDLVIILGDRYEIFSVCIAAHLQNVLIAHLHGGELTHGAIDDAFRHSITKMAHLHFVSNQEHKMRVIQLGENPKSVFNFGAIGIDNIKKIKFKRKKELEENLKIKFNKKNIIITFHPETINANENKIKIQVNEILSALKELRNTSIFITKPGADLHSDLIIKLFRKFAQDNKNCFFFSSLGQKNYFSMLKFVDLMIGNSSSGIIEMPSFNKMTINLGNRQEGRLRSKSVIDCKIKKKDILKKINFVLKKNKSINYKKYNNPYYQKDTIKKITRVIKHRNLKDFEKYKKFYDLKN